MQCFKLCLLCTVVDPRNFQRFINSSLVVLNELLSADKHFFGSVVQPIVIFMNYFAFILIKNVVSLQFWLPIFQLREIK